MVRHAIHNSRDISISEVSVLGGHDGFDVRTCDDISIENCRFITGDDCIAGFDNINVTDRDNIATVDLCRVLLENLKNPKILCSTDAKISIS